MSSNVGPFVSASRPVSPHLSDNEKEAIIQIFNKYINTSLLVPRKFNDPLFDKVICFDAVNLVSKVSRIWNEIFSLYGWCTMGNGRQVKTGVYVEVHNTWSTLCNRDKVKAIIDLNKARINGEVVFGAIVDKDPKDYYADGVRILTGSRFLRFMLPMHQEVFDLLYSLVQEFNERHLAPYIKCLSSGETEQQ